MFILQMQLAIAIGFVVSLEWWFNGWFVVSIGLFMQCQIHFCWVIAY